MKDHDLPTPTFEQAQRERALTQLIIKKMNQQQGSLSFGEFMALLLYHPDYGYYTADAFTIGKTGDFITAPHLSPLFAQCFANACKEILRDLKSASILELGAGTGQFAHDLLLALDQANQLPDHYYIYEISAPLRKKQQQLLRETMPHLYPRLIWLQQLPDTFRGIIIGNEVLDALPTECVLIDDTPTERRVGHEQGQFVWQLTPASSPLKEKVARLQTTYSLPRGYESEVNLQLMPFIAKLTTLLETGVLIFSDYGYGEAEYYHPARKEGTLTCFYRHHRHRDPFIRIGLQDITAHVNFTEVADIAIDHGAELLGFTSQASFLLANGLIDLTENMVRGASAVEAFRTHQAIKTLTLPTEMGEVIKVMAIGKGIEHPIPGFSLQDKRREL